MTLRLLVVSSETPAQQAARRARSGQASHETFAETLTRLDGDVAIAQADCLTGAGTDVLARHDGILFAGSPIQMHEDTPETRAAAAFMERVYASGVPSFGSCAGLQIATVGAGGTVEARPEGLEAGFARGIVACAPDHPMLTGREIAWDALAMHSSQVARRPGGMTVLARSRDTPVEAAEIRSGQGVHWGTQYHPELSPAEIAEALDDAAETLVAQGKARDVAEARAFSARVAGLDGERPDLAWQMGVQPEITRADWRAREILNFLAMLRTA